MTTPLLNDRYQIIRTLGSGGFGETFLAEDTHMPSRRRCVVKRLRPVQENPQINQLVQERFQREAAILEELGSDHGQIPALYAYFYGQVDQQFYLVQEWVDGDPLATISRQQGKLNEAEVRRILIALLPIFDYIHRKSIIHRDVKPDNIILRRLDQQPVLIDFGAVRETMGTAINSQGRPTQSIIIGTPGYMASEQSVGRPVYSSDLYSLGLTAIYLLTGKQPQEFITNPTTGEILWRSDAPHINADLGNILDKAIAFHPRDRYQTANEFLAALQGVPEETKAAKTIVVSPAATQVPEPPTVVVPSHNHNLNLLLIGGIVTGIVLGIAAFFMRTQEPPTVAVNPPTALSNTPMATPTNSSPSTTSLPTPVSSNPPLSPQPSSPEPINDGKAVPSSAPPISRPDLKSAIAPPANVPSNVNTPPQSSCSYFMGTAIEGQAVNVDLCSIEASNPEKVSFIYYLGNRRMGSEANCSTGTWTTFPDRQVHRPLSSATQKMIDSVCSDRPALSSKPQTVTALIFAPPTNIRESPGGKILCSINQKVTINTYGVNGSWHQTDVCGAMGVVHVDQLKF